MNVKPANKATEMFVDYRAQGGHFRETLALTGAALAECYCRADGGNRRDLIGHLASSMEQALIEIYGWSKDSAAKDAEAFRTSLRRI